jgi:hypothetical protein
MSLIPLPWRKRKGGSKHDRLRTKASPFPQLPAANNSERRGNGVEKIYMIQFVDIHGPVTVPVLPIVTKTLGD